MIYQTNCQIVVFKAIEYFSKIQCELGLVLLRKTLKQKQTKPQPILLNFFFGPNILGFWSNFKEMWIWIRGTRVINLFFHFKNLKKISESFKETGEERRIVNFNVPTWCSDLASVWLVASCRPRHHHCLSKELSSTLLLSPLLSPKYCR